MILVYGIQLGMMMMLMILIIHQWMETNMLWIIESCGP